MSVQVHPSAVVDPGAQLGDGVVVGPFSLIEDDVVIGPGTVIQNHVTIKAHTTIGSECRVFPYAALGTEPQDTTYKDEATSLVIGDRTTIRECSTFHRGTGSGRGVTTVGSDCMFMAYSHVAHDCQVGDHVIFANTATLGGHVIVEDWVFISAFSAAHQFTRLGAHSFVGAISGVSKDVPPYCMVAGNRAHLYGLNSVGLKRRGFSNETICQLKEAYRLLFRNKDDVLSVSLEKLETSLGDVAEIKHLVEFIRASQRGICR